VRLRHGLLIKDDIASSMVLLFYQKNSSEELFMHPSRRVSFNLVVFFCGRTLQAETLGLVERIWERSWFHLLCCTVLLRPVIHLWPWGLPNRARTASCVFKCWILGGT